MKADEILKKDKVQVKEKAKTKGTYLHFQDLEATKKGFMGQFKIED